MIWAARRTREVVGDLVGGMDQEGAAALVGRGGLDREDPEDDAGEWRRRETGWMDWTRVWTKYIH